MNEEGKVKGGLTRNHVNTLLKLCLDTAVRNRWPRIAGRIMAWSCTPADGQRPSVLLANPKKDGIVADAQESLGASFQIIQWPAYVLKTCAEHILSEKCDDANAYKSDDPEIERSKAELREFWGSAWNEFRKHVRVDAVISSNFGFKSDREFAAALEALGVPFIVIQKENLNGITQPRWDFWYKAYRGRGEFTGRKILTYNEVERDLQIASGVAKPAQVVVTGMPRLDRMHAWRRENSGRRGAADRSVVFFAFDRRDKIPPIAFDHLSWGKFCEETHRAIYNFAVNHPAVRVVVKTKGQTAHLSDILRMFKSFGPQPKNLQMMSGGDPIDLIVEASVVVGFNTTAILETLAVGKPVIVPRFEEALLEPLQAFILNIGNAPEYAASPADLMTKIEKYLKEAVVVPSELRPEVSMILKKWVGNDDGHASDRVFKAICAEVAG